MPGFIPSFSHEQWTFLAVLEAFGNPVPISIAGQLAPLMPGPLFELITKCRKLGWILQDDEDRFSITENLPHEAKERLATINTPEHLAILARRMRSIQDGTGDLGCFMLPLMEKGGLDKEACGLEMELAHKALLNEDQETAWGYYKRIVERAAAMLDDPQSRNWFIHAVLQLSNLSFALGKGIKELSDHLHHAQEIAKQLGDARSHALINFHLGRLYYFSDCRSQAIIALSTGLTEVEELGDEDILDQSSAFVGLFYFMQGLFRQALAHLERAERVYESRKTGQIRNPLTPILQGYCLVYLGEFHRAIGYLDFHWRSARERSDHTMAVTLQVILGMILLQMGRKKEAKHHIKKTMQEAEKRNNALAIYFCRGQIALMQMRSGQPEEAYKLMKKTFAEGAASGLVRQYASPWVLEMLYEFEKLGFTPISGLSFQETMSRAVDENNVHLLGVAMRLQAQKKKTEGKPCEVIFKDLLISLKLLKQSGDIIQQSTTLIMMARLELSRKKMDAARRQAKNAWKVLGGYAEDFFPDDLRHLLEIDEQVSRLPYTPGESFNRYMELLDSLFPATNQDEILARAIVATNRFFGAERGGLFWFPGGKFTKDPELRASCNLSIIDTKGSDFRKQRELIQEAFLSGQHILHRIGGGKKNDKHRSIKSVLCLPVEVDGKVQAIIYHDNTYLEDCFDFLDSGTMKKIVAHISRQMARIYEYIRIKEERNDLMFAKSLTERTHNDYKLIYHSRIMADLIEQADRAARSVATILILGETGVGKEILARRIHAKSDRRSKPFIVVDATTIPGGLIESELFGHEKGAFTGADRQKKGRLELANRGTLFIDEIGELPKLIQAKFLRSIQERNFFRVGGNRLLFSDFRLIAATNRDLWADVHAGRFREDLYYRLNVVPIHIPPLRDRKEDIPVLARYFFDMFARKFQRYDLVLDTETESTLKQYHWPGNIRELQNVMERAVLLSTNGRLEIDLSAQIISNSRHPFAAKPTLNALEKEYIRYILEITKGKIGGPGGASEILGIKRSTLYARMKKLGLR